MQNISSISCRWTQSILTENGWNGRDELINHLDSISENKYVENNLQSKAIFIQSIRRLITAIEVDGDAVKEAKQMTRAGSILESLNCDYLFIRNRYLEKRKKLREQLLVVNALQTDV
jgi:hypothetical protein